MPAHRVEIDGIHLPAPVGGHPALDFCNTRAGWDGPPAHEYLLTYHHLVRWAAFAGLLDAERLATLQAAAARRPAAAAEALSEGVRMRDRLRRALAAPCRVAAVEGFVADARAAAAAVVLAPGREGPLWEVAPGAGLDAPVLAAAWAGAALLTGEERRLITACPGAGCGWLFLNRSGRRRWCVMATCGNRAKARRYVQRRR